MDNTTAVAYINHLGGTRSQALAHSACHLWLLCLHRGITLSAEHLPGTSNSTADRESRIYHSSAEWKLHTTVCSQIFQWLVPCKVDLFASRLNNQLDQYVMRDPFRCQLSSWPVRARPTTMIDQHYQISGFNDPLPDRRNPCRPASIGRQVNERDIQQPIIRGFQCRRFCKQQIGVKTPPLGNFIIVLWKVQSMHWKCYHTQIFSD